MMKEANNLHIIRGRWVRDIDAENYRNQSPECDFATSRRCRFDAQTGVGIWYSANLFAALFCSVATMSFGQCLRLRQMRFELWQSLGRKGL